MKNTSIKTSEAYHLLVYLTGINKITIDSIDDCITQLEDTPPMKPTIMILSNIKAYLEQGVKKPQEFLHHLEERQHPHS